MRIGFEPMAYQGLETGERNVVSHAIRQNKVRPANKTTGALCTLYLMFCVELDYPPHHCCLFSVDHLRVQVTTKPRQRRYEVVCMPLQLAIDVIIVTMQY